METTNTLNQETISGVQSLIEINIDSAKGFDAAAEKIEDGSIASMFRDSGAQRRMFAEELQRYVSGNGQTPADSGTARGAIHRWWLQLRGTVQQGDEHAMLAEAERGEDAIKARYESVLKHTPGNALNDVLLRQLASVKRDHDRIRDMRDARA